MRWRGWKVGREGGERRRSVTCQVVSGSGGRGRKDGDEKEVAVNISPKVDGKREGKDGRSWLDVGERRLTKSGVCVSFPFDLDRITERYL